MSGAKAVANGKRSTKKQSQKANEVAVHDFPDAQDMPLLGTDTLPEETVEAALAAAIDISPEAAHPDATLAGATFSLARHPDAQASNFPDIPESQTAEEQAAQREWEAERNATEKAAEDAVKADGKADDSMYLCGTCREFVDLKDTVEIQKENLMLGNHSQRRCRKCHNLRSRLFTVVKSSGIEGYKDLSEEERVELYKCGANLFGGQLTKLLQESVTKSRLDKQITSFKRSGEAMDFDEAEEKWRDKPEEWKSILENAPRFHCPIRNKEQIVPKPKYLHK